MADFLLEIGTEELPAGMVEGLFKELRRRVEEALNDAGLSFDDASGGGAPRRIWLLVKGLPGRQPDRVETVLGPPWRVAVDEKGDWTKAALGFARKKNVEPSALKEMRGAKGSVAGFERKVPGKPVAEILAEVVPGAVNSLYLPKSMRWGSGEEVFARPVRWVVALLDEDIVPMTIKGTVSGRTSRGHRIHSGGECEISSPGGYFNSLREARVLADPEERRKKVQSGLKRLAGALGGRAPEDPALLHKLIYLAEFPTVIYGAIGEEFLDLPSEILVACLREHQNVFVVLDEAGGPLPRFLAVVDTPSDRRGLIRIGFENVSSSRLADARFFYEHDINVPLEDRIEELKGIVFHPKLGSYYDKALRMEALARKLAPAFGAGEEEAAWAAKHAKCDLVSLLIQEKEFVGLQGIAGGLYARSQGKPEVSWRAIYDQYKPASLLDALPRGSVGSCVAAADKLDTLWEMFRVGLAPSGSKDPYALRRAAIGLLRILTEQPGGKGLDLPAFLGSMGDVPEGLVDFLETRFRFIWEKKGFPYDEVDAVLSLGMGRPHVTGRKLAALHAVRERLRDDFDALSVAFKRSGNILKGLPSYELDPALFLPGDEREGAGERALYAAYLGVKEEVEASIPDADWEGALTALAKLRPAVDLFFDDVLVMCDPEGKDSCKTLLQRNRLALLQRLKTLFDCVADFGRIVPK